jgi:hypothetical protein
MVEPGRKRAVAFFDGQNLFRHSKDAFGFHWPNYDPRKLTELVCARLGFDVHGVRFYTGTPRADKDPRWHAFWHNRLLHMRRTGILVVSRELRYRSARVVCDDGSERSVEIAVEKGIDIRLALDVVRMA